MSIVQNYAEIRKEIPEHVTIVLAAKTRTTEEILEAISAGATHIGHNYMQESQVLYRALGDKAKELTWHMIGHLQTNKINKALTIFDVIQTIDSIDQAVALNKRAEQMQKQIPIYIEINSGDEATKSGVKPDYESIKSLVQEIAKLKYLKLEGFMTMGPITGDPELARPFFRKTKEIFDKIKALNLPHVNLTTLSMGMSNSYKVAIEEGSTMIRLGTIIFGERR